MKKVVRLVLSQHPVRSLEEFVGSFGNTRSTNSSSSSSSSSQSFAQHQRDELKRQLVQGGYCERQQRLALSRHGQGFYYTITEACLVVLYEQILLKSPPHNENNLLAELRDNKEYWIPLNDELLSNIDARLRPECPYRLLSVRPNNNNDDADDSIGRRDVKYYLQPSTRSAEWLQIAQLERRLDDAGPRLKRRSVRGLPYYELLPAGYRDAGRIR
eukprot:CAMPEP_0194240280 /NCGR_PEP_ID=MMETSP0158-20130606/6502_1 /TAXON_ID=33649 /ORGANISM="Thalassionema nitzschioides, Strain L26-B" /LENGTH=214 /DNA_ID=CAMNT_0038974951 /DNA_START=174 /DNA_END=815 /DNA_ORIENTATION=-